MITNFPIVFGCPPLPTTLVIYGCINRKIPDIAYDGFLRQEVLCKTMNTSFAYKQRAAQFVYLDAAHDFEGMTNDQSPSIVVKLRKEKQNEAAFRDCWC